MEYTKGEWKAGNIDVVTKSTHIANCYTESNFKRPPIGEALANAHLIAAAPDMYEALKVSLAMNGCHNDEEAKLFDIQRQALAKAEGK